MDKYDLAIIGGGPAGYHAAGLAASGGLKTILFEADKLGGVCLNEGCIPTKAMLNASKHLYYARNAGAYGVMASYKSAGGAAAPENPEFRINHEAVLARKEKVIRTLTAGVRSQLKSANAEVAAGKAEITGPAGAGGYIVTQSSGQEAGRAAEAARVLIATGSSPVMPPLEGVAQGLASGFVITSTEALSLAKVPERFVIIGGGIIGLELADYYNSAGSQVTVVEMLDRIAYPMESETSRILFNNLKKRGVNFMLGSRFTGIVQPGADGSGGGVTAEPASQGIVPADKVLVAIGRRPNISGAGIERLGIYAERGAIVTDDCMRTNVPGIYAAGDVNGKLMLAHTAYREAECAVSHMLGSPVRMRYDAIPSAVYTNPESAGAGETEESAAAKGLDVKVVKLPLRFSGRYIAEVDGGDGICKVIFDRRSGAVLGAHIVGPYASEIIVSAAFMIESKRPAKALRELTFPHPTVGEALREAIFEF